MVDNPPLGGRGTPSSWMPATSLRKYLIDVCVNVKCEIDDFLTRQSVNISFYSYDAVTSGKAQSALQKEQALRAEAENVKISPPVNGLFTTFRERWALKWMSCVEPLWRGVHSKW